FCQFKSDGLMAADFLTKSFSGFTVFLGQFIRSGSNSEGLGGNSDSSSGEGFHGKSEPKSVIADAIFLGHLDIVAVQGMGIASPDAQLIFLGPHFKSVHSRSTIKTLIPWWPFSGWVCAITK